MRSWKKKIQNNALISFNVIIFFLFLSIYPVKAAEMIGEKYLFSFKTRKSTCLLRVNDFPAIDNTTSASKVVSAGFNLTAFLENGSNDIELLMGPQDYEDPKTIFSDSFCELTITKDTEDSSTEIASFKLTVNENGEITARDSVVNGEFVGTGKILEGYTKSEKDFGLYKLRGSINVKGLPKWSWAGATPVKENDLLKIRKAYSDIWNMIQKRDIDGLKKVTHISTEEMAYAEGSTTEMMFISTDFPKHVVDKEFSPVPIVWDKYEVIPYRGGRLFRLAIGFFQNSPLKFQDSKGKTVFVYNPYFSIIDGKVVLVR